MGIGAFSQDSLQDSSQSTSTSQTTSSINKTSTDKVDPIEAFFGLSTPYFFLSICLYTLIAFKEWSSRWWISSTPLLSFLLLLGPRNSLRSEISSPTERLPHILVLNTIYLIISTSWLSYTVYSILSWPIVTIMAISNSTRLQHLTRRSFRRLFKDFHYFSDKIASFNLPALVLDVNVDGIFIVRGITLTLSNLIAEGHGIELSVKFLDSMELVVRTEKMVWRIGRSVELGDIYVNFLTEMDTGPGSTFELRRRSTEHDSLGGITNGKVPEKINMGPGKFGEAMAQVKEISDTDFVDDDEEAAKKRYDEKIKSIQENSRIDIVRKSLQQSQDSNYDSLTPKEKKALMSSKLQLQPSVVNPPDWCFTLSQMRATAPPWLHRLNNRFPFLIRTLLNVICHLHPVKINGIIITTSGLFASGMLQKEIFKHYKEENKGISKLASRIEHWLESGNFVIELSKIKGIAQVPFTTIYDIIATIKTSTVQVFKVVVDPDGLNDPGFEPEGEADSVSIASEMSQKSATSQKSTISLNIKDKEGIKKEQEKGISEVARINGIQTTFEVPSMLIPHHEYLFPPPPASKHLYKGGIENVEEGVQVNLDEDDRLEAPDLQDAFDGREPAKNPPTSEDKDEVIVLCTILASLPAQFNSTILHFATALLKTTKLIEIEKNVQLNNFSSDDLPTATQSEVHINELPPTPTSPTTPSRSQSQTRSRSRAPSLALARVGTKLTAGLKKTMISSTIDDAWIAKLIKKFIGKVENLKGEVGYKMPIPVDLGRRRVIGLGIKGTAYDYGQSERMDDYGIKRVDRWGIWRGWPRSD